MKKIVMYGPGTGHNIDRWLAYFNKSEFYTVTFIYYGNGEDFENKYPNIVFKKIASVFRTIYELKCYKYDVFIAHGAYSIYQTLILSTFIRYDKLMLVIWGNSILNCFNGQYTSKRLATYKLLMDSDYIVAPDELLEKTASYYPKTRLKKIEFLWGLTEEYFLEESREVQAFTKEFLSSLGSKFFIYWPRSILRLSRFDIGIDAIEKLRESNPEIVDNIRMIIWTGNSIDEKYLNELESKIKNTKLDKVISIVVHPFLPDYDIKQIWERADLSMNLIENDGFSTQLGESFSTKTPLIVNELNAYRLVKSRFDIPIEFTPINAVSVSRKIKNIYLSGTDNIERLKLLKYFSDNNLKFEENLSDLLRKIDDN